MGIEAVRGCLDPNILKQADLWFSVRLSKQTTSNFVLRKNHPVIPAKRT